jgi:arginase
MRRDCIDATGVRFDGSGRRVGQAGAAQRLREEGLAAVLHGGRITSDIVVSDPNPGRGPLAGFANERALLESVEAIYSHVRATLIRERFPLLYGGDCSVLLGAVPALRDAIGSAGLLFVDGHEDATTMHESTTGEVANMEIALLLGLTGEHAPEPLRTKLPALQHDTIEMLGQRDAKYREQIGVGSIADRVRLRTAQEVRCDPEGITAEATARIANNVAGWWLHIDLDVLDGEEFSSCGAADDPSMPPGLTWSELTAVTKIALRSTGCQGWSIGVYNPDLDPDGYDARRIVAYIAEAIEGI